MESQVLAYHPEVVLFHECKIPGLGVKDYLDLVEQRSAIGNVGHMNEMLPSLPLPKLGLHCNLFRLN
jgi:hypothetical protein